LIGTPPNIIVASYRAEALGESFGLFDYALVGLPVALAGLIYLMTIGWRLLPGEREGGSEETHFAVGDYLMEALVPEGSALEGAQVRRLEELCGNEATVMTILRGEQSLIAPAGTDLIAAGDLVILEGDPAALEPLFSNNRLTPTGEHHWTEDDLHSDQIGLMESVVMPNAPIEGRSMRGLHMHEKYGVNLLAMARRDLAPLTRLGAVRFQAGDVLLMQGEKGRLQDVMTALGCLPLAARVLRLGRPRRPLLAIGIFGLALVAGAFGIVPIQVAFFTAVVTLIFSGCLSLREAYDAIEWPIVILLACLLPLGGALKSTGGTDLLAGFIVELAGGFPLWATLAMVIAVSMLLSDLVHNSPTAVLMAPIAMEVALRLGASPDAFLMAVAIGAASPYLTPIGHPSNTLVMAPGGYHFSDFWRLGLPLDLLIIAVATPLIIMVWA
ncbi:MAG: SLC13 family permease, partial [Alphaproteobacteria bacterium]